MHALRPIYYRRQPFTRLLAILVYEYRVIWVKLLHPLLKKPWGLLVVTCHWRFIANLCAIGVLEITEITRTIWLEVSSLLGLHETLLQTRAIVLTDSSFILCLR